MSRINDLRIGTKLIGAFVAISLVIGGACLMAWKDLTSALHDQEILYTQQLLPMQQVETTDRQLYKMRGDLWKFVAMPEERPALATDITTDITRANEAIAAYRPSAVSPEDKAALASLDTAWPAYQAAVNDILAALSRGHKEEAERLLAKGGPMNAPRVACTTALESVVVNTTQSGQRLQAAATARVVDARWWLTLWGVLGVAAALMCGTLIARNITRPLRRGVAMMQDMGRGRLGTRLRLRRRDEIGVLADTMDQFAEDLQTIVIGTMQQVAAGDLHAEVVPKDGQDEIAPVLKATIEALRGLVAQAGVLSQAAVEGRLATRADASKFQGAYRSIVEGVNGTLDAVIGPLNVAAEYVDRISKGDIPPAITDTYHGDFNEIKTNLNRCIDGLAGLVEANRVLQRLAVNDLTVGVEGQYQGVFAEVARAVNDVRSRVSHVQDTVIKISQGDLSDLDVYRKIGDGSGRRSENDRLVPAMIFMMEAISALVSDANQLSRAAVEGRLATRANATRHQGDFQKVVQGVNATLDAVIGPLNVAAEYVDRISKGDIPPAITDAYQGDFNEIKGNLNQCIGALNTLVGEMTHMSTEHDAGDIDVTIDATKFHGAYQAMARGINQMVAGHITVKKKAMACIAEFGKGNFEAPLERFPGKKVFINNTIEQMRENLKSLIADANTLVEAAVAGRLATRADASKHQGDFRTIVDGVNRTLDAVIGPLNVAAEYVDRISKGDTPPAITDTYQGDFNEIKQNLNACIHQITTLVAQTGGVIEAAREGRLSHRADAECVTGVYRKLLRGLNDTLEAVLRPVNEAAGVLATVAQQDLRVQVQGQYAGDHAAIKTSINTMIGDLRTSISAIGQNAQALGASAEELSTISQQMAGNAEETATQTHVVSAASEQVSQNLTVVATSSEEMLASIREIAKSANEAARMAKHAVGVADATNQTVQKLGDSSQEIGNVIKVITSIAEQTNLLALNATIEAARAGDAGKGFAVVANEVKELAKETAKATEDISQKIEAIQQETTGAVQAIGQISQLITQIDGVSNTIATAVEEQTATTNEIGRNITEAARGSSEIARNVGSVAGAAQQASQGAADTQKAARALTEMAAQLQGLVGRFHV